jgi:hypothetical protein
MTAVMKVMMGWLRWRVQRNLKETVLLSADDLFHAGVDNAGATKLAAASCPKSTPCSAQNSPQLAAPT